MEGFLPGCNGMHLYFEQTLIGCLSTPPYIYRKLFTSLTKERVFHYVFAYLFREDKLPLFPHALYAVSLPRSCSFHGRHIPCALCPLQRSTDASGSFGRDDRGGVASETAESAAIKGSFLKEFFLPSLEPSPGNTIIENISQFKILNFVPKKGLSRKISRSY